MNKKSLSKAGFTLVELLAVITILGILLMVAIPSVSRTIENARRDTFVDNALTYISTVRTAVLSDELVCAITEADSSTYLTTDPKNRSTEKFISVSATPNGVYFFQLDTREQSTADLMEKVSRSPWGNAEMQGYVRWYKQVQGERTFTTYYIRLADNQRHGMASETEEKQLSRTNIKTSDVEILEIPVKKDKEPTPLVCVLK